MSLRSLVRTVACAVTAMSGVGSVEACYWCLQGCAPAGGSGLERCVTICRWTPGDPFEDCQCIAFGPFCWNSFGLGKDACLVASAPTGRPSASDAGFMLSIPAFWSMAPKGKNTIAASLDTLAANDSAPAARSGNLPAGCTRRQLQSGATIVECGRQPSDPSKDRRIALVVGADVVLQIAEYDKDLAAALWRFRSSGRGEFLPAEDGEMNFNGPSSKEEVQSLVLKQSADWPSARQRHPAKIRYSFLFPDGSGSAKLRLERADPGPQRSVTLALTPDDSVKDQYRVGSWQAD